MTVLRDKHQSGDVVFYHRNHGVHRGVVLSSGQDGARVFDTLRGDIHEVVHLGIYRHATVHGHELREAVSALHSMGIPVTLTDEQRSALRGH